MTARPVEKTRTNIAGFDHVARGGLPAGRATLVAGTSGSAKTVFASQFLAAGIREAGESGVFVTFEEPVDDVRRNLVSFGWDVEVWEREGKWAFVDASPDPSTENLEVGDYDLGALLARIGHAVKKVGAKRLVIDSVGTIFSQLSDATRVRRELFHIAFALKSLGVTSLITAERASEYGEVSRFGIEEFVSDNVIILRNALEGEARRRTVEILKFRGTDHRKGEHPFSVIMGEGIVVIPLSAIEFRQDSSEARMTSGSRDLDAMCGGGFFRDSIVLVSGATGTGKTLMATEFMTGGVQQGDRCLLFAFEESRRQLFRNAGGWGVNFEQMERDGKLLVVSEYPESASLEDHLIRLKMAVRDFQPDRIAVDSISALERVASPRGFREFVIGLTSFVKSRGIAAIFTATTPDLFGGSSVTDANVSTITDTIVLLRYVEMHGVMRRGLTVLKMRGSRHDKEIREFVIDDGGMHIGKPFRELSGILTGAPHQAAEDELQRIRGTHRED